MKLMIKSRLSEEGCTLTQEVLQMYLKRLNINESKNMCFLQHIIPELFGVIKFSYANSLATLTLSE